MLEYLPDVARFQPTAIGPGIYFLHRSSRFGSYQGSSEGLHCCWNI